MMHWRLTVILTLISLPAIFITTPGLVRNISRAMGSKLPPGKTLPAFPVLEILLGLEVFFLVVVFAVVGSYATTEVRLYAPFFTALVSGENIWRTAKLQLLPMLLGGSFGGLVLVAGYYLIFRPRLDVQTVRNMERLRMEMGLAGRLLYGGILEEVLTRWGMMSAFAWLGSALTGSVGPAILWAAIFVSGIIFGLLHIPNYVLTGSIPTLTFIALMIFLNLWASLVFGWLFWHYGLLAVIGAYMLFHLIWYPIDVRYAGRVAKV